MIPVRSVCVPVRSVCVPVEVEVCVYRCVEVGELV